MREEQIDKSNPTADDYVELLEALMEEAKEGKLKAVTFMLQKGGNEDRCIIDSYGSPEHVEIACRKTVEFIAIAVSKSDVALGNAIATGLLAAGTGIVK